MNATSGQSGAVTAVASDRMHLPDLSVQDAGSGPLAAFPSGDWVIASIAGPDLQVSKLESQAAPGRKLVVDLSNLKSLDTSGAWLLSRLRDHWVRAGGDVQIINPSDHANRLLRAVVVEGSSELPKEKSGGFVRLAENVGRLMYNLGIDTRMGMNIIGAAIRGPQMKLGRGGGVRPISIIHHIDRMGIRAVPIVMLMSFLIGAIVAQQSAFQLRTFGLEVWSVDLVGVLLLREVGVLLTAIMLAGRSGSAMTAEIGSMKMREEVDALTVIGLNPIGVLIFPRLVALTIALPLLAFLANMAALAGACLVLRFYSDISIDEFILRLRNGIDLSTVFSGLIKAPFMAMIIGVMAAVEGLKVEGSAESLGRRTTAAVVKAIFFVIVVDGLFAVFYAAIDY